ncbi:hypothetical protein DFH06DRAFT_1321262 [Mycena polygramma]|nr:hypothetical protein DFH06DRAFT_1321262 [Mycena polygramma]
MATLDGAHSRTQKKVKQRPNPLFTDALSPLSLDICARFPTELHDYIIDHLHRDKRALLTCSLVCSAWSASSRYHLFQNASTIHVHRGNLLRFCELLSTQRLNSYIGRLHLDSHLLDDRFAAEGPNADIFQFNSDLHRFTGLPCLKYLRLDYHHDGLLPPFFAAVAQNFPTLTDLEFTSMHFNSFSQFLQIMDSLPLLRRLSLAGVVWYDHNGRFESNDNPPTTMPYLSTNLVDVVAACGHHDMIATLLWLPFQPCIRRLVIGKLNSAESALFSDALRVLGPGLEHLIVHGAASTHVPDLSPATALRTFEITDIQCLPTSNPADLEWVSTLLSQLKSPTLERIVLIVDLRERAGLDLLDWPRIAELLAGISSLRRVEFSLSYHKNWAAKAIAERLSPRTYALRVRHWEGRYRYSLASFDS